MPDDTDDRSGGDDPAARAMLAVLLLDVPIAIATVIVLLNGNVLGAVFGVALLYVVVRLQRKNFREEIAEHRREE